MGINRATQGGMTDFDAESVGDDEEMSQEKVFLMQFGGSRRGSYSTEQLREKLLHGPQLRPVRDAADSAGQSYVLPGRALLFVKPDQHSMVRRALIGKRLVPWDVIITQSFVYLLREVLETFTLKTRPREKESKRLELELGYASSAALNTLDDTTHSMLSASSDTN